MTIEEIKSLMKSGDIAGAEAAAKGLLVAEPDNAEAQMLYGTCRQLLGDDRTFAEIHDALAPKMVTERNAETLSLWRRYHKLWMTLIAGGLVLAGVAGGVWYSGKDIVNSFRVASHAATAYAGPPRKELRIRLDKDRTCPLCNGTGLTPQKTLCESCGGYGKGRLENGGCQ